VKELKYSAEIRILGNKQEFEKAKAVLNKLTILKNLREDKARIVIQDAIDEYHLNASILYKGNRVWSRRKILNNLERIIEKGTLYGNKRVIWMRVSETICLPETPADFKPVLSKYFYEFLIMCCGSIAHYNLAGWIGIYPTLEDLKRFFLKNEHGKPVSEWIPWWKTDAKRIVEDIERRLFPFRSYVKSKQKQS
jgi:hypothetical protein